MCWQSSTLQSSVSTPQLQFGSLTILRTSDSMLPVFRAELPDPFAVTGVDFAQCTTRL